MVTVTVAPNVTTTFNEAAANSFTKSRFIENSKLYISALDYWLIYIYRRECSIDTMKQVNY